ncbi:MAG: amidohydrolase [Acidimicrobiia bacterium]
MNADLVIRGGRIFTARQDDAFVSAVASSGDRIVALGEEAETMIGSTTRVIDLAGGLATPGFIDAHVHPASSGLDKLRCHFDGCSDAEAALARIAEYSTANPDLPWIIGAGWPQSWFANGCPPKELLDEVVPHRPALITNTDGHGSWANSRALAIAGIDMSTPDPIDGRIERLSDGSPQGTLHEGATKLVERHAPPDTVSDLTAGLLRGQEELHRFGITGWQDAIVDSDIHQAYLRLTEEGRLTGRVVGAMWWSRHLGLEQVDELVDRRRRAAPGFAPTSVKLMLDGVVENFTASMLEPFLDGEGRPTGNRGIDFIDPGDLGEIVTRLDALGFQCHFHAIGDGAVRSALDSVETARQRNGRNDNRHHIAHIQVVHPDDIGRFAALDVVANAQPLWACNDEYQVELTRPFIGEQRSGWQYPFASLLRAGSRMGMGSDWGVSTCNVMAEIEVAVTRTCSSGRPLGVVEAISPIEALTAFTAGSAYINHAEAGSGRIAVGMLADLAVLDRDPLRDGPLREAEVMATVVGGEVVYENA